MKVYMATLLANSQPYSSLSGAQKNVLSFGLKHTKFNIPGLKDAFQQEDYYKCVTLWNAYCREMMLSTHYFISIKQVDVDARFV